MLELIEITDEVLNNLELIATEETQSNQEWTCSGAALYSSRFGIEENNPLAIQRLMWAPREFEQYRQIAQ